MGDGKLFYVPVIQSKLLDLLDRNITYRDPSSGSFSTETFNAKYYLKNLIQETIYRAQYPYENVAYPSSFGSLLGRWLAGREAPIRGLGYAPRRAERPWS